MDPTKSISKLSIRDSVHSNETLINSVTDLIRLSADPVVRLPSELIGHILALLDPLEVISIRRVSRSWRNSCDYHVGVKYLEKHYPQYAPKNQRPTRKEANLHFRRICYGSTHFMRGRASGFLRIPTASRSSLMKSFLVWWDGDSHAAHINILDLSLSENYGGYAQDYAVIPLHTDDQRSIIVVEQVLSTGDGNALVRYDVEKRSKAPQESLPSGPRLGRLVQLKDSACFSWNLEIDSPTFQSAVYPHVATDIDTQMAIGESEVYTLYKPKSAPTSSELDVDLLYVLDLRTGDLKRTLNLIRPLKTQSDGLHRTIKISPCGTYLVDRHFSHIGKILEVWIVDLEDSSPPQLVDNQIIYQHQAYHRPNPSGPPAPPVKCHWPSQAQLDFILSIPQIDTNLRVVGYVPLPHLTHNYILQERVLIASEVVRVCHSPSGICGHWAAQDSNARVYSGCRAVEFEHFPVQFSSQSFYSFNRGITPVTPITVPKEKSRKRRPARLLEGYEPNWQTVRWDGMYLLMAGAMGEVLVISFAPDW